MYAIIKLLYITLFLIGFVLTYESPFEKCRFEDSVCLVNAFQKGVPIFSKGIPELGVDAIDPLVFDEDIVSDVADLSLTFSNVQLKGYKNVIIDSIKLDRDGEKRIIMHIDYHGPSFSVSGTYKANGKILILPIIGDGQMEISIKNIVLKLMTSLEEKKKDNKTYITIKSYKYDFQVEGGVHYNLTNLFNGNKELSETTLTFLNDNWQDITNELGRPLMDAMAKKIIKNVNRFFSKAPLEEISLFY